MLESVVELLGGLFLSALTLLIGSCIVAEVSVSDDRDRCHDDDNC